MLKTVCFACQTFFIWYERFIGGTLTPQRSLHLEADDRLFVSRELLFWSQKEVNVAECQLFAELVMEDGWMVCRVMIGLRGCFMDHSPQVDWLGIHNVGQNCETLVTHCFAVKKRRVTTN